MIEARFADSLWAATAPPAPETPRLEESLQADVVVIGAGYTGLSTALHLARRGIKAIVLEAEEPGFGGSGRNLGHCTPTFLYRDPDGVRRALGRHVFVMAHMSHAYPDGCSIYFTFAASAGSDAACERLYDQAWRDAMDAAIESGGTLSHHHGVGRSKAPQMGAELGLGVELVRAVKRALDPEGVFNPGNLLPDDDPPRRPFPPPPDVPELDASSQLMHAAGTHTLADVERAARVARLDIHHFIRIRENPSVFLEAVVAALDALQERQQ